KLSVLLLFLPVAVVMQFLHVEGLPLFLVSALGILGTVTLIAKGTEEIAIYAGPLWGGLLNATFGNVTELIIALFALSKGLHEVVLSSITGSILGNLLLVLGAAMVYGGQKYHTQKFSRTGANVNVGMLWVTIVIIMVPSLMDLAVELEHHISETVQTTEGTGGDTQLTAKQLAPRAEELLVWAEETKLALPETKQAAESSKTALETGEDEDLNSAREDYQKARQTIREQLVPQSEELLVRAEETQYGISEAERAVDSSKKSLETGEDQDLNSALENYQQAKQTQGKAVMLNNISLSGAVILLVLYFGGLVFSMRTHKFLFMPVDEEHHEAQWSKQTAIYMLLGATLAVAYLSEAFVGSIEHMVEHDTINMSEMFIGVIVVAVVGNAAEGMVAVWVARDNKMELSFQIAMGSCLQVALMVTPLLVIASLWLGKATPSHPDGFLSLQFNPFELLALIAGTLIATAGLNDGESNWLEGMMFLGLYLFFAMVFWFHP
ncbi:MAG: hypothetical protein KDA84_16110, partial [Planctomycetaceae bacterium]|nr:hypothetical protein [Planctomycetaceae bacterium]